MLKQKKLIFMNSFMFFCLLISLHCSYCCTFLFQYFIYHLLLLVFRLYLIAFRVEESKS